MMDVTVYWNRRSKHPSMVEKHSTPIITAEGAWDCLRVGIFGPRDNGEGDGVWTLGVEAFHPKSDEDKGGWRYTHTVIAANVGGEEGFYAWLEENVNAIHVDGYPWWIAPEEE